MNLYKWLDFLELQNVAQNVAWWNPSKVWVKSIELSQYQLPSFHIVECYYYEKLGEGYTGTFCTIFATSCKSIIVSKNYHKGTHELPMLLTLQQQFHASDFENLD